MLALHDWVKSVNKSLKSVLPLHISYLFPFLSKHSSQCCRPWLHSSVNPPQLLLSSVWLGNLRYSKGFIAAAAGMGKQNKQTNRKITNLSFTLLGKKKKAFKDHYFIFQETFAPLLLLLWICITNTFFGPAAAQAKNYQIQSHIRNQYTEKVKRGERNKEWLRCEAGKRGAEGREETSKSEARLERIPFATFQWLDELKGITWVDRLNCLHSYLLSISCKLF